MRYERFSHRTRASPQNGVTNTCIRELLTTYDANLTPDVCGRGILWGPLANEAVQTRSAYPAGTATGAAQGTSLDACTTGGGSLAIGIPSLSGTSDLSSGIISGLRRALVWGDDGGAVSRAGSVVSRYEHKQRRYLSSVRFWFRCHVTSRALIHLLDRGRVYGHIRPVPGWRGKERTFAT